MGKSFSLKLAITNIKNNRKFYLPYVLAAVGIIAMFYIMCFLTFDEGTAKLSGNLVMIMGLGTIVIAGFAVVFLFYINSFLMKRRKKEIGLYNILGMEKKHIGRILLIENFLVSCCAIIIGLLCGILFSKLVLMFLVWMFEGIQPFGFSISLYGIGITTILFGVIFAITLIVNQMSIHLAKPIELIRGTEVGEKEPKTKGALAVFGAICLGAGYFIAITTDNPLDAILLFFVAVVLVIIGTYCLFVAGSIAILKLLKKNRKIYYKPGNFTAISGMIYRMKQNAVGLANICVLSTMVLVMISGTVSLSVGMEDAINSRISGDIVVSTYEADGSTVPRKEILDAMEKAAKETGLKVETLRDNRFLAFTTEKQDNETFTLDNMSEAKAEKVTTLAFLTAEEFNHISGEKIALDRNQVVSYSKNFDLEDQVNIGNMSFDVIDRLETFVPISDLDAYMLDTQYIIVADEYVFDQIYQMQLKAYEDGAASTVQTVFSMDLSGSDEEIRTCYEAVVKYVGAEAFHEYGPIIENKPEVKEMYAGLSGGFLFLGVFLGIMFTFAAALIIYYKQISEGYYDKDKFEIMQKVGMSKKEVRTAIKKQVLMVFFLPLLVAGIHVLAAFGMICKLLMIFSLNNVSLFAICTVATFLVFAAIYAVVYLVTAREYYKIVGNL